MSQRRADDEIGSAYFRGPALGAVGTWATPDSHLPMTLPPADHFAHAMSEAGVGHADRIVLYDRSPLHSSARAWWMLTLFGARSVALLDGGLEAWTAAGHPVMTGPAGAVQAPGLFLAQPHLWRGRKLRDVQDQVEAAGR